MIYPRCKASKREIYISSEGIVSPCCWIANEPHPREYRRLHEGRLNSLSVNHRSLDHILDDPLYQVLEKTWTTNEPFTPCLRFCSEPIKAETSEGELQEQGTNGMYVHRFKPQRAVPRRSSFIFRVLKFILLTANQIGSANRIFGRAERRKSARSENP